MLLIGLRDQPSLFVPLEHRIDKPDEPVAVRCSLGWTVMGPVGGQKSNSDYSVNFVQQRVRNLQNESLQRGELDKVSQLAPCNKLPESLKEVNKEEMIKPQPSNSELHRQLERLWTTDFRDSNTPTKPAASVENKKARQIMEESLKLEEGHFQLALPWRRQPPNFPNYKSMVQRRLQLLKKRLLKDEEFYEKYGKTMQEYIDQGHAEKVPVEELEVKDRSLWYLPHHAVTHPLKPGKVRVVFDCAAKFEGVSLNDELMQGPDLANSVVSVLIRFRQEPVACYG